jgi:Flp pilus assembly protein TadB
MFFGVLALLAGAFVAWWVVDLFGPAIYYVPASALLLLAIIQRRLVVRRDRQRRQRLAAGLCPSCGYDLTGNVSGVCPECGTPVWR